MSNNKIKSSFSEKARSPPRPWCFISWRRQSDKCRNKKAKVTIVERNKLPFLKKKKKTRVERSLSTSHPFFSSCKESQHLQSLKSQNPQKGIKKIPSFPNLTGTSWFDLVSDFLPHDSLGIISLSSEFLSSSSLSSYPTNSLVLQDVYLLPGIQHPSKPPQITA